MSDALAQQKAKARQFNSYCNTLQKLSRNISTSSADLLVRFKEHEPSLMLHLHQQHFRFEQQDGVFLYSSPMRAILEAIRSEQIPADCIEVFRDIKLKYFEGCLIVRLIDHRTVPDRILHTVLKPSPESLWAELLVYSDQSQGRLSDYGALQIEGDILVASTPPLNLKTYYSSAMVHAHLAIVADPPLPPSKKRRVYKSDAEGEDERLMFLFDEKKGREFTPDFKRLSFVEAFRRKRTLAQATQAQAQAQNQFAAQAGAQNINAHPASSSQVQALQASHQLHVQNQPLRMNNGSPNPNLLNRSNSPHIQGQTPRPVTPMAHQPSPLSQANVPLNNPYAQLNPHLQQNVSHVPHAHQMQHQNHVQPPSNSMMMPNSHSNGHTPNEMTNLSVMQQQQNNTLRNPNGMNNSALVNDLARQQQIMLQQRSAVIRNMQAQQAAQAAQAQGIMFAQQNAAQGHGRGGMMNGMPGGGQVTGGMSVPTPLQMQSIRQQQAAAAASMQGMIR